MGAVSIIKNLDDRFFSDFGGLRIKESGLRLGDKIFVRPFNGNKYEIELNRLSYRLIKGPRYKFIGEKSTIEIPFLSKIHTEYKLILCSKDPESTLDNNGRYLLRAIGLNPFKHNGNYTFEAFLEYGDIVELEYSRLEIKQNLESDNLPKEELGLNPKIVESDLSILIEGETGTGKSRLAKKLHEKSFRAGAFIHINISSYSSTLIESELFGHVKGAFTGATNCKRGAFAEAHKGTLFIDEIDSLPFDIQTKLLLFLDNQKIRPVGGERDVQLNVRLIFSSGRSLRELVSEKQMRADFYYRLSTGGRTRLASLKEDPTKITELLREFELNNGVFITVELKKKYRRYTWPGNIRQLLGHLEQKLILASGGKIDSCPIDSDLEHNLLESNVLEIGLEVKTLDEMKKVYVLKIFEKLESNIKKTARVLGISPNTVRGFIRP